jgi:hypothetical protein
VFQYPKSYLQWAMFRIAEMQGCAHVNWVAYIYTYPDIVFQIKIKSENRIKLLFNITSNGHWKYITLNLFWKKKINETGVTLVITMHSWSHLLCKSVIVILYFFYVFLTVHHSINLFLSPTWCTFALFCNICITLDTSTCFKQ